MIINIEELAKKYTDNDTASYYFNNCVYNGSISQCRSYLQGRIKIAEKRGDAEFIDLVNKILDGGLVKFKKNSYEITMLTDFTGYIDNTAKCDRVVWFTIYDNKKVAYDFPFATPKYIREYVEKLAKTF